MTRLRRSVFFAALALALTALFSEAFAACPPVTGNAGRVSVNDLNRALSRCVNENGAFSESQQVVACNALVRYGCTPSRGRILSTEDREILVWAYSVRASVLLNLGRTDSALADMNDALEVSPNNPEILTNRCRIRAAANFDLDLALADCDAAVRVAPSYANALDSRGLAHLRRQEFEAARADYDTAISQEPRMASALYGRAIALSRLGFSSESQRDIREAAAADQQIAGWFTAIGLTP